MNSQHFLLISCTGQGHINPTLQLAIRLIHGGARVTFATTVHGLKQIKKFPSLEGLSYASFSDGFDDGNKPIGDPQHIMSEFKRVGSHKKKKKKNRHCRERERERERNQTSMNSQHFLLISCTGQGHINPTLQLAIRLIHGGARVTFATTVHGLKQIKKFPSLEGLSYASFSDGFDDGNKPIGDPQHIMSEFKRVGSQTLTNLIVKLSNDEHHKVTFLVYTILLPWAADVARDMGIPSAFLSIQSTAALAIYQKYFNTHDGLYHIYENSPPNSIQFKGLPPFASSDLPSFLLPTSPHNSVIPTIQEHIQTLEKDPNPCVLLNTFDALEEAAIEAIVNLNLIPIGPLVPSTFFDTKDQFALGVMGFGLVCT
ncbi:crocetin glucosyltransferase [Quercus suber]|uniref:Crocetin glucosyltransferase n=1 Tax=Quercus suber TaxID=58331 RepID=A0AAW0KUQ7_QUESU